MDKQKAPVSSTLYTEEYFRTACEGYDEFNTSEGEQLSRRLASAFSLAEVRPGMQILDVGCGRGEILHHAAQLGADAYGIDYAEVAVNMSKQVIEPLNGVTPGKTAVYLADAKNLPFATASFDRVDFHEPIDVGELVTLEGTVTYVGRTSMEITIEIYADNLMQGTHRHTNTARVTMVALRGGKPAEVPHLICETREDKIAYLTGRTRRKRREVHLSELKDIIAEFQQASDEELDAMIDR